MTGRGGGRGKVLLPPINLIFKLLQQHSTVSIWLYEQLGIRIEGKIRVRGLLARPYSLLTFQGFDEFMNLVLDDAVQVSMATRDTEEKRRPLGRFLQSEVVGETNHHIGQILLKGDNVTLIQSLERDH